MRMLRCSLCMFAAIFIAAQPAQAQDSGEGMSAAEIVAKLVPKKTRTLGFGLNAEKQTKELEQIFEPTRSIGVKEREKITAIEYAIKMPSLDFPIYFASNSFEISAESFKTLEILSEALANDALSKSIFLVKGHTDAKGSESSNQRLSEARAASVVSYLVEHFKVDPDRLKALGYGETQIRNTSDPESGDNRRVELVNTTIAVSCSNRSIARC
jgi:outer membrane protein OmpA-like peptidoglycan-associated protein